MDDRAVSTVSAALAATRWLSVPCPVEYLPALARDVLKALEDAGFTVAQLRKGYDPARDCLVIEVPAAASREEQP